MGSLLAVSVAAAPKLVFETPLRLILALWAALFKGVF